MLTRDKRNFLASGENRTSDPPVQWLERPIFIVFPVLARATRTLFSVQLVVELYFQACV